MGLLDNLRSGSGPRPSEGKGRYGLEQAAKLLRSLPPENMELALTIVKKTLESFDVDVGQIVLEAEEQLARTEGDIAACEREVTVLRDKLAAREAEIAALRASHDETLSIKQHLEEVRDYASGEGPVLPPEPPAPASAPAAKPETASVKQGAPTPAEGAPAPADRSPSSFFKRKDI